MEKDYNKTIIVVGGEPRVVTGREVVETRIIARPEDLPQFCGSLEATEAVEAGITGLLQAW